jgi:hypothetical protein
MLCNEAQKLYRDGNCNGKATVTQYLLNYNKGNYYCNYLQNFSILEDINESFLKETKSCTILKNRRYFLNILNRIPIGFY